MNYIKIEGVEKQVSRIMMGTGWFTPEFESDILPMLDAYYQAGGRVLDTGRFYAGGKSEPIVRKWLDQNRDKRENLVITSKACHHYVDEFNVHHTDKPRVTPEHITEDLEFSLNRLGLDYFDVFLMHRDNLNVPVDSLMDRLEKHYQEGKFNVYGVSNWTIPRIEAAMNYCTQKGYAGLRVNSPSFSLAKVETPRFQGAIYAAKEDLGWFESHNLTVFAWAAQGAGFFGNAVPKDETAPADLRKAYFTEENFKRLERAKVLASEKNCAPTNISLAYVLAQPLNIAGVIAPHSVAQLENSLRALNVTLSESEIDYLERGIERP